MKFAKIAAGWICAVVTILSLSGCSTVIVRNKKTVHPFKVFPATSFDSALFWDVGICGKPLFPSDNTGKNYIETQGNFLNSAEICIFTTIDMPFSIISDVVLLPVDLIHLGDPPKSENKTDKGEQGAGANG